jgi:CRP-like cAMP-binding protein
MAPSSCFAHGNLLLKSLSAGDRALLQPHLERVKLPVRRPLEKPNTPIRDIFFVETGIVSVVALQPGGTAVEIGIIGYEGMSGAPVLLGSGQSPHSTYIQISATAQRIGADEFRKALDISPSLRAALLRFVQAFVTQASHTAIANARATLHQRLARWLLMAHDRVPGDTVPLTHEFLALMLAVRRAGVTTALHAFKAKNLIQTRRGEITILDREEIEKIAGHYYGVPEAEYRRLVG